MDEDKVEDAAILLMSLGEHEAAEVFKHLGPKEVQKLGETIARLRSIPQERVDAVINRFGEQSEEHATLVADTGSYVKNVLRLALGDDKANLLDASSVAELLRNEHPQIAAAILVHLDADQVTAVLKAFTERQRNEVLVRIATLDGIQPTALRDLNDVMSRVLASGDKMRRSTLGGPQAAAEIINMMGSQIEVSSLDYIRELDAELAQKIQDNMFTFDDLEKIDDRGIQAVLKEVQSESLVLALKGASPEMREKVFRNMSSRAAETLREDLDGRGPVRVSEVEAEQKEMLKIVRRLADEGTITLVTGGADDFL